MITLNLVGVNETVVAVKQRGPRIVGEIARRVNASLIELQSYIVGSKLSGQVLKHRSGKLANSIRVNKAHDIGSGVLEGSVQGGGGPAFYGRIHEYGGSFIAARRLKRPPHLVTRRGGERVMTGSPYGIRFAERSFMRTGFAERQAAIMKNIREGIAVVLSRRIQP